jgi:RecA-family ATPase
VEIEVENLEKPKLPGELKQLRPGEWSATPKPVDALLTLTRKDGKTVPWLPRGTVALLASPGGTGKSTLVMQLVLSVASGVQWLDTFDVVKPGTVCVWSGEDEEEDMHRRAFAVANALRGPGGTRGIDALPQGWEQRVWRVATNGEDSRFVDRKNDALDETLFFASVREQVETLQPALVVLDPASRFMGTEENDNAQATRWITLAEQLKNTASKPVVLVLVHTGKGKDLTNQEAIRGASALVDGARWAATLSRRTQDGDEFDILQLRRVKNNRCPPDEGAVLLERDDFGCITYASAAAEIWWAQQLIDATEGPKGAAKREAEAAAVAANERAVRERLPTIDAKKPKANAANQKKGTEHAIMGFDPDEEWELPDE